MNNKILIPGVALGAVLIALAFVVAPVQEASAVHTTIQANTIRHFLLTAVVSPDIGVDDAVDAQATWTLSQPFVLINASFLFSADTGTNCDMGAADIRTNFSGETAVVEPNPAAINAATDTRSLFITNAVANSPIFGSTILAIATTEGANCHADSRATIQALIETTGSLTTAPTAVNALITAAKAGGLAGS